MSFRIAALAFVASALATPLENVRRDACNPCNPEGATGSKPPSVGPDLSSLYLDVLTSVKDIHFKRKQADTVQARDDGFCCTETLDCVKLQNLNIPMCYDKFTTNFAFPDRSYGSLTTGEYMTGRSRVDLFTGQFETDGEEGNIYSDDPSARPNTETLSIPPQWTSGGVGSAIPATAIVGSATAPAATSAATASGQTSATAESSASQPTGSSTPSTTSSGQDSEATSSPSEGAATRGSLPPGASLAMSLFTALMCTVYSL